MHDRIGMDWATVDRSDGTVSKLSVKSDGDDNHDGVENRLEREILIGRSGWRQAWRSRTPPGLGWSLSLALRRW